MNQPILILWSKLLEPCFKTSIPIHLFNLYSKVNLYLYAYIILKLCSKILIFFSIPFFTSNMW